MDIVDVVRAVEILRLARERQRYGCDPSPLLHLNGYPIMCNTPNLVQNSDALTAISLADPSLGSSDYRRELLAEVAIAALQSSPQANYVEVGERTSLFGDNLELVVKRSSFTPGEKVAIVGVLSAVAVAGGIAYAGAKIAKAISEERRPPRQKTRRKRCKYPVIEFCSVPPIIAEEERRRGIPPRINP